MNVALFKSKIVERGLTMEGLAKELGISVTSLWRRNSGEIEWRQSEIQKCIEILKLSSVDVMRIFLLEMYPERGQEYDVRRD